MSETASGDIWIVGLGARTAVGLDAPQSAAAVRAGVARTGEHPEALLRDGEPMVVARIPDLEPDLGGGARLVSMLAPTLQEALEPLAAAAAPRDPMPLVLGLPGPRPGRDDTLEQDVAAALADLALAGLGGGGQDSVEAIAAGHASGLAAMDRAAALLGPEQPLCLVAGADSYMDPETLTWLAAEDRALSGSSPHGFIPGEGAGCLLLATAEAAQRLGLTCLGRLAGAAVAQEEHTIHGQTVCTGQGLTTAWREALERLPEGGVIHQLVGDMNGQPYRGEEYAYALIRNRDRFADTVEVLAPADRWGDVGAASALLAVVLACRAGRRGYAPGPNTLVWASSVDGLRGAAVLDTVGLERDPEPTFSPGSSTCP